MHSRNLASYVDSGGSNLGHDGYGVSVLTPQVISSSPDSILLRGLRKGKKCRKLGTASGLTLGKTVFSGLAGKMKAWSLPHNEFLVPGNTSCG